MEKIKITREQENLLKRYKEKGGDLGMFIRFRHVWMELNPLTIFSPEEFSLLLHGWYEVEEAHPSFEVGSWIESEGSYYKIVKDNDKFVEVMLPNKDEVVIEKHYSVKFNEFSKVNEPWKIKLLETGREKPEFKSGDVVVTSDGMAYILNDTDITLSEFLETFEEEEEAVKFFPAESGIEVKS